MGCILTQISRRFLRAWIAHIVMYSGQRVWGMLVHTGQSQGYRVGPSRMTSFVIQQDRNTVRYPVEILCRGCFSFGQSEVSQSVSLSEDMGRIWMLIKIFFQLLQYFLFGGSSVYDQHISRIHESVAGGMCVAFDKAWKYGLSMQVYMFACFILVFLQVVSLAYEQDFSLRHHHSAGMGQRIVAGIDIPILIYGDILLVFSASARTQHHRHAGDVN